MPAARSTCPAWHRKAPTDPPGSPDTFAKCRIDWSERETNGWAVRLHRDLIRLRRTDPVFVQLKIGRAYMAAGNNTEAVRTFMSIYDSSNNDAVKAQADLLAGRDPAIEAAAAWIGSGGQLPARAPVQ